MSSTEPREVVQAQIDAYHAHDLDLCMSFYAPSIVVKDADGSVLLDGSNAVRARYETAMTTHPNLHYDIVNRIALGPYVIDEERVTGYSQGGPRRGSCGVGLPLRWQPDQRNPDPLLIEAHPVTSTV